MALYAALCTAAMLAFSIPVAEAFVTSLANVRNPQHLLIPDRSPWFFLFQGLKRSFRGLSLIWPLLCVIVLVLSAWFITWDLSVRAAVTYRSALSCGEFVIGLTFGIWMINLSACIVLAPRCRTPLMLATHMVLVGWIYLTGAIVLDLSGPYYLDELIKDVWGLDPLLDLFPSRFWIGGVQVEHQTGGFGIIDIPLYARHWFNATIPPLVLLLSVRWMLHRGRKWFGLSDA